MFTYKGHLLYHCKSTFFDSIKQLLSYVIVQEVQHEQLDPFLILTLYSNV